MARSTELRLQCRDEDEIQVCLIVVVQLGVRAVPTQTPSLSPGHLDYKNSAKQARRESLPTQPKMLSPGH